MRTCRHNGSVNSINRERNATVFANTYCVIFNLASTMSNIRVVIQSDAVSDYCIIMESKRRRLNRQSPRKRTEKEAVNDKKKKINNDSIFYHELHLTLESMYPVKSVQLCADWWWLTCYQYACTNHFVSTITQHYKKF